MKNKEKQKAATSRSLARKNQKMKNAKGEAKRKAAQDWIEQAFPSDRV